MWCGLLQDRLEICRTVVVCDCLHVGRLIEMLTNRSFQLTMAVRHADQSDNVSASRRTSDPDLRRVDPKLLLLCSEKPNGGFAVVD